MRFMEHPEELTREERHSKPWGLVLLEDGDECEKEVDATCLISASLSCAAVRELSSRTERTKR